MVRLEADRSYKVADGSTKAAHLKQALKSKKGRHARVTDEEAFALDPVVPPIGLSFYYNLFWQLSSSCRDTGFSISRIKPSHMQAWIALHGLRFNVWEVSTMEAMDATYLSVISNKDKK